MALLNDLRVVGVVCILSFEFYTAVAVFVAEEEAVVA